MTDGRAVLVDTGPLIALFNKNDDYHQRCVQTFNRLRFPLLTVWPVITEAMYLLSFSGAAQDALWEWFKRDAMSLAALSAADIPRIQQLMKKYRNLPMDLADAALVCVAEREKLRSLFTLDLHDFRLYPPSHVKSLELLPV